MVGLVVSILAAWALAHGQLRGGAVLLALAGLFDFFDGSLARLANSVSAFGAFLDSVADRYSDLVVLLGVVLYYHRAADTIGVFLTMGALVGTIMTSYTKARAQSIGVPCEIGLIERPERLIVLIAGATFNALTPAMVALALLTNLTALQRILYMRRAAAEREQILH
jgi:CDP-diacylglycerol--glycerol-3-phosphate 3-phosphatidyltransferase